MPRQFLQHVRRRNFPTPSVVHYKSIRNPSGSQRVLPSVFDFSVVKTSFCQGLARNQQQQSSPA
jgi:hypothetical protein